MTNEPREILFVCTGNICRSPMAQLLAARFAREAGLDWRTASAGVEAEIGHGIEPGGLRALAARGIKGTGHLARQLDEGMLAAADVVYAMTKAHRSIIVSRFPAYALKVSVLREAAGLPDAEYEQCAVRIEEALKILIRRNSHAEKTR